MMTKRILVAAMALVALGACKKSEEKQATPKTETPATATVRADAGTGTGTGTGTGSPAIVADAGAAAASDKVIGFFYEVEKDGKVSHLVGTMHMGIDPKALPDAVYAALDKAKTFAMETDLTDTSVIGDLMLPEGKTLEGELGPEYWAKLEKALGPKLAAGMNRFKPSTAASLLELEGLPMTDPMDMVLLGRAKDHGASIVYLEPAALQAKVLDKWLDVRALKEMLDDLEKNADKPKEMLDAYKAGDEDKVAALTADKSSWKRSPEEYDEMMNDLLYARNASWIPALETMLGAGDAFVAVGAAHLIGERSVTDLLRKKGFTITRVAP
jgi:uncharacterized protein YbaP (TraB family)